MAASHDSLRDDFEVSCKELDVLVDIARKIGRDGGVIGARMTGGGFGGSTVTLCESRKATEIAATLAEKYEETTGIKPQIFASRPSRGPDFARDRAIFLPGFPQRALVPACTSVYSYCHWHRS
jgi:galactokinase